MTDVLTDKSSTKYPKLTPEAIDDARALIGIPLRRRPHYTVASRDVLLRYAKALGCRNPLYSDLAHGTFYTHWGGLVGHPTVLFVFDSTLIAPKLPGIHTIYGGVTIEWFRQIRAGDRLTATAQLVAVEELEGDFCGEMVRQTGRVEYRDQHGDLVAVAHPRALRTPRGAARERGKYKHLARHHYSEDEFVRIIDAYQREEVRGSDPLYFEDVVDGSQLPEVVKGPLTTEDMNFFVGEVSETLFYREFVAHMRRHPADVYWHEDKNMPDSWDASLLIDKVAEEFGFPCAHDTGLQRIAWLECLVTNWMGDLAMLRKLDVRLTAPFLHADTAWLRGEVVDKHLVNHRTSVELSLRCENQRGEVVAAGSAEVELPSKDFDVLQPGLVVGPT